MSQARVPYRPPLGETSRPRIAPPTDDDRGGDLGLQPIDCPSREQFAQHSLQPELSTSGSEIRSPGFRFSVLELLVITAAVAVGLAGGKWMPPGAFALLMGIVTLGGLLIVELYPPQSRGGWMAWIAVVVAYLAAWMSALIAHS